VKRYLDALSKAVADTAAYMTYDVRHSARSAGWSDDEARALRVRHTDGTFGVHFEGPHAEAARTREYGTETTPPSAVARKYGHSHARAATILTKRLNKHLEGK
jgi:hypothetical protein